MTFKEWYANTYRDVWTDEHAPLYSYIIEYEEFCKRNNIDAVWNG